MLINKIGAYLKNELKNSILRFNEEMRLHTSFKIGGIADIFISHGSIDDIKKAVVTARNAAVPLKVIGCGSNLLISDNGVRGIVLDCKNALNQIIFNDNRVIVGAGCLLKNLSLEAAKRGLSGLEFAVGIPGSVGGALIMNAGANDCDISTVVATVNILDTDGNLFMLDKKDMSFGYRHSRLNGGKYIILSAELVLNRGNKEAISQLMENEIKKRNEKFPLDFPNAGSIFKRPKEGYPGKWIEMAGCKGMRVGDAEVSIKHANFIINRGNAKACDVLSLIDKVKEMVFKRFNVTLEPEIIFWDS